MKTMMKRLIAGTLAAAAVAALSGCSGGVQDPKHLLVAHGHGEWHPVNIGLTTFAEAVEEKTDYTFSVYPNGQLGDDSARFPQVHWNSLILRILSSPSPMCSSPPNIILTP